VIRVMIERRCLPGKEARLRELLVQIRAAAMRRVGFISGETLRSADDPSLFLTVGTWTTREAWKAWDTTPSGGR